MGTQLARMAFNVGKLSHAQRLVLVAMAVTARDADVPPVYFGGWDYLALALGRDVYDEPARYAVQRVLRVLVDRGLVTPDGWDFDTHQRRYVLHLLPPMKPARKLSTGGPPVVDNLQNDDPRPRGVRWANPGTE